MYNDGMEITKKYYTVTDLAGILSVSRQRIHQMIQEGKIKPSIDAGSIFLFSGRNVLDIKLKFAREPETLS